MILLYTFEGGVKTIVYTDTLQTTGMLLGLVHVNMGSMSRPEGLAEAARTAEEAVFEGLKVAAEI